MDIYHIWCDLKPGISDQTFSEKLSAFMDGLKSEGRLENWRLMRCKLGLAPDNMPEFHIMIETRDLAQLDSAFRALAPKTGEDHVRHFQANGLVQNVKFALYRDWPDQF
ncbi:DUF6614 family protein [Ponticaulis sp.]|uniref:DUF6614 family protein n=1 Tax=Ponticaulis sp. TaxID=2020902 RepID=UPI000B6D0B07|nr:DUF6614 family protein [Ponticaulis sp.]MAI90926.1 hypothetical protein [Ponticaulis sp.]OUX98270.1 MAG: hypothetical protein CBB65_10815 [Hyphomonadaceae bacterium TMED5]|tara:strand:- start:30840 stop:31166 length:327 start_codon:yes stop_codon:yes gene_type:complete